MTITPVYDFDADDSSMLVERPEMRIWGAGTPKSKAIPEADAAFVMIELVEWDGEPDSPASVTNALEKALGEKLNSLLKRKLPRAEMILQLGAETRQQVSAKLAARSSFYPLTTGNEVLSPLHWGSGTWEFTAKQLDDARAGKVVTKELSRATAEPDGISTEMFDDSLYKVRLRMGKQK